MNTQEYNSATEYESAADWCAARGISGAAGSLLPTNLSRDTFDAIGADTGHFQERVRCHAYARAMESTEQR